MAVDIKFLSARRSYEFRQDDVRLTLLGSGAVLDHIRQHFGFQGAEVATPQTASGQTPLTFPAGLIFTLGIAPYPGHTTTAIRFLTIESRRIVIDLAGTSSALDPTFDELRRSVQELRAPDGSPAIGEPRHTYDSSELTVELPYAPSTILPPGLRSLVGTALGATTEERQEDGVMVPVLQVRMQPGDAEYLGSTSPSDRLFQFELRAGTAPENHLYYSSATLDTDAHLRLIESIAEVMASQQS